MKKNTSFAEPELWLHLSLTDSHTQLQELKPLRWIAEGQLSVKNVNHCITTPFITSNLWLNFDIRKIHTWMLHQTNPKHGCIWFLIQNVKENPIFPRLHGKPVQIQRNRDWKEGERLFYVLSTVKVCRITSRISKSIWIRKGYVCRH